MISIVTIKQAPNTVETACKRSSSSVGVVFVVFDAGIQLYKYQNEASEMQMTE